MADSPPFFIIGAPRSGTTHLARVLHRHRRLVCTDETRVLTWVSRALNDLPADQRTAMTYRDRWLEHLRAELPGVVTRFYRGLGARQGLRWGDKNPHYADPRTDPACLPTIDELFPGSQFIHIVRDGRNVIVSLQAKGWARTLAYGIDVWRRHVEHSRTFGAAIGPERFLELRYEDLVADEPAGVARICSFLGVGDDPALTAYLRSGEAAREAVSAPITPAGSFGAALWQDRLSPEQLRVVEYELADLLVAYGYETSAWRDTVRSQSPPPPADDREAPARDLAAELAEARAQVAQLSQALHRRSMPSGPWHRARHRTRRLAGRLARAAARRLRR